MNILKSEGVKVLKVMEEKVISEKFRVKTIVLEIGDKYPEPVAFRLTNQKIDEFIVKVGDVVDVCFNIRGKEYTTKDGDVRYYNNLDIWSLEVVDEAIGGGIPLAEKGDDLPF